jgi:translation initiation factor IF-3
MITVKELNFHLDISPHDYEVKMRHAEEFMWKEEKVILHLKFRGREMPHQDAGLNLVRKMRDDLAQTGRAEADPRVVGKSINLFLSPLPVAKRKRRFSKEP